jgi:hypothetical protein
VSKTDVDNNRSFPLLRETQLRTPYLWATPVVRAASSVPVLDSGCNCHRVSCDIRDSTQDSSTHHHAWSNRKRNVPKTSTAFIHQPQTPHMRTAFTTAYLHWYNLKYNRTHIAAQLRQKCARHETSIRAYTSQLHSWPRIAQHKRNVGNKTNSYVGFPLTSGWWCLHSEKGQLELFSTWMLYRF